MKQTLTLLILLAVLSACGSDPLGMTSREQARSDAQQAQWNAQARQAEAQAKTAEAQAKADVEKTQIEAWSDAIQKVEDASKRNLGIVYLLILSVVGLSGTAIYWMGRTNTAMAQNAPQRPLLTVEQQMALLAQQQGLHAQFDGQRWLLVDDAGVVKKQQKLLCSK